MDDGGICRINVFPDVEGSIHVAFVITRNVRQRKFTYKAWLIAYLKHVTSTKVMHANSQGLLIASLASRTAWAKKYHSH